MPGSRTLEVDSAGFDGPAVARLRAALAVCVLTVLMSLGLAGCTTRHRPADRFFFVTPERLPDGTSAESARRTLESWLIERAGGFTDLGEARGAWRDPAGERVEEMNRAYFVSVEEAPAEFERELERLILTLFDQEEAYVQRW